MRAYTSGHEDFVDSLQAPTAMANDPLQQLLAVERNDWAMLRLVMCSAVATFVMGLAGSLFN